MAKKFGKPGARDGKTTEVDITPLIDVTFLLIVFFMSIWQAAHMEVAAELNLPDASQGNPERQQELDRFIINIDKHGDYHVANARLSGQQLVALINQEAARSRAADGFANRPVFIRADANLPFKKVRAVMLLCRDARIWRLSFRTRVLEEEPEVSP